MGSGMGDVLGLEAGAGVGVGAGAPTGGLIGRGGA